MTTNAADIQTDAIEESWRLIHELVTTGKAKHRDGTALKPGSGELVRLAERMAHLRPPKKRQVGTVEGFVPQTTSSTVQGGPSGSQA